MSTRIGDWWWQTTHPPLEAREENVVGRGLIRSGADTISTVSIREMRGEDFATVERVRLDNRRWLAPWDATVAPGYPTTVPSMSEYARYARGLVRRQLLLPLAVCVDDEQIGQITIFDIVRGACHSGAIGYWVSESVARRGIMTLALSMALDVAFVDLGLHRVEINICPSNAPSLGLARKLGMRHEGVRRRYIHIGSHWADHVSFALTAEDIPEGGFVHALTRGR
ncbi:GNAT family N-acetyltransferase [Nanchangia anserum]|uniref:GNAT family N-acetyltransferase n=1 Tax=Nanchangia anserum TaxID=2692125 RepID=A0A8I0G795_9ACTO|nr:GNAT family protein [Nanchangia anserum]MBD3689117.1 GNAT family N-acetyltransferase [Nanchangia anserum]QOX81352.1 GNAT family N-acetyltransferase [Nanchangia anserum]